MAREEFKKRVEVEVGGQSLLTIRRTLTKLVKHAPAHAKITVDDTSKAGWLPRTTITAEWTEYV